MYRSECSATRGDLQASPPSTDLSTRQDPSARENLAWVATDGGGRLWAEGAGGGGAEGEGGGRHLGRSEGGHEVHAAGAEVKAAERREEEEAERREEGFEIGFSRTWVIRISGIQHLKKCWGD